MNGMPFGDAKLVLASVAIYALVTVAKRALKIAAPRFAGKRSVRALILTPLAPALGALAALIPGFLPGGNYGARLAAGLAAGLLSHWAYGIVRRRTSDPGASS